MTRRFIPESLLESVTMAEAVQPLDAKAEQRIRKMVADHEYCGAANDAIPTLLDEVDRLRDQLSRRVTIAEELERRQNAVAGLTDKLVRLRAIANAQGKVVVAAEKIGDSPMRPATVAGGEALNEMYVALNDLDRVERRFEEDSVVSTEPLDVEAAIAHVQTFPDQIAELESLLHKSQLLNERLQADLTAHQNIERINIDNALKERDEWIDRAERCVVTGQRVIDASLKLSALASIPQPLRQPLADLAVTIARAKTR